MCDFRCDVCVTPNGSGGFVTFQYEDWVGHLISRGHQVEIRRKQSPKQKWRDEDSSFVLTGLVKTNGPPWPLSDLAEWLSTYGVLTQFMHNDIYHFCVFTLQGIGKSGKDRVQSIANQKEFRGHELLIRPKRRYGPLEWDLIYDIVNKDARQQYYAQSEISSGRDSVGKSAATSSLQEKNDPVPAPAMPSSNATRGTRVFTNKNQSSNLLQQSPKGANGNNNNPSATESPKKAVNSNLQFQSPSKSSTSSAADLARDEQKKQTHSQQGTTPQEESSGKKKRKAKDKKKQKENAQNSESTPTPESGATSKESTPRASTSGSGILVPPSSLIPQDPSMKNNGNTPLNQRNPQQERLNFRGGFTPSGRGDREYRMSESSDSSYKPEAVAAAATTPSSSKSAPQVQLLQKPAVNDSRGGDMKNQRQRQNGVQPQQPPNNSRRGYVSGSQQPSGFPPRPPGPSGPHQRVPQNNSRPYQQHNCLVTPIFTSQVAPLVADKLSNPCLPTARNPYKFDNMPPFPYFFDLFQKLPDESFKPHKELLFKHFQQLALPEQLEEFFLAQTLPFEEVRLRWQVILDTLFLLRQQFPRCEMYAFGSILTGLGDFMSDIDIYVDLVGESTSTHPIDPSQKMSGHQAVDTVKKIIRKSLCPHNKNRFVKNLIPVKSARVPILKLTHTATLINCDLSFENRLSVQNTKMLSFYLNLDPRIFRFMVLIRYWAKFHHLTGSNHIKNYALTLMVLVYLTRKGFVPPVELLQRLKAKERKSKHLSHNPDEIDGWDSSFCDDVSVIKKNFTAVNLPSPENARNNNYINQAQTLIQMTIEFFEMFANLDFSKVVVCPLLGEVLAKEKFYPGSEESLPDTLDRYKNWAVKQAMNRRLNVSTHLCVQDPFVLSFNVGSVTPQGTLLKFQIACAKGLQILRQRNGLKSLLDVLERLPAHIGEKKFMKTYKTERIGQELKREIKASALGESSVAGQDEQASTSSPQTSSFVTLPSHLRSFDKLMDEKGLKQTAKKPRWEIYLDFSLGSQFEDTFVAELTRRKMQNNKRSNLMDNLCALWHEFTLDFLTEFFETGLKLKLVEKKETSVEPYYATETNGAEGNRSTGDEEGKRKRWKVKMLNKQEEEKLLIQADTISRRTPEEIEKLTRKISELPVTPGVTYYKVVRFQVAYPFWEKRPTLLDKVVKEMKANEMVQIPVLPTSRKVKKDKNKGRRGKNEKDGGALMGDGKSHFWHSFNPIDLEAKVSEIVAERYSKKKDENKDFAEFQFNVLVKLDLSSVIDRPEIFFIFEKDTSSKCNSNDYFLAIQCLGNILTEAFPRYQIYRLAKWLNMPSPDVIKPNVGASNSTTNKEVAKGTDEVRKVGVGADDGDSGETKKKSTRSKQEEDLLIPSSSSSECSEDENENNDGLEDISNDEEDENNGTNDEDEQSEEGGSDGEVEANKPGASATQEQQ